MMTPFHTDWAKYSAPSTPTTRERRALRVRRQTRRAAFLTFFEKIFSHSPRSQMVERRPRFKSPS